MPQDCRKKRFESARLSSFCSHSNGKLETPGAQTRWIDTERIRDAYRLRLASATSSFVDNGVVTYSVRHEAFDLWRVDPKSGCDTLRYVSLPFCLLSYFFPDHFTNARLYHSRIIVTSRWISLSLYFTDQRDAGFSSWNTVCSTEFATFLLRVIFSADLAFKASGGELEKAGTGMEERIRHCETVLLALSSAIRTIV